MKVWYANFLRDKAETSLSPAMVSPWRKVIIAHPYVNAWVQADGALRISVRRQRRPRDAALK